MNIYDFDNTIYDGESIYDFFIEFMKINPSFVRFLPKIIFAFAKYKLGKVTVQQMLSDYVPLIEKCFCEYDNWEEFTQKFWDSHMHKIKSFYSEVRKEDDLILTASPDLTIDEIAKRLGIRNVVCSQIDKETGKIKRICMRENKIRYLKEDFGDVEIDDFYTDSIKNDGFFAGYAKRVFIVNGNKITRYK